MAISERLKHFRINVLRATAGDLSSFMGISKSGYYAYENGNRGISNNGYVKLNEKGCDLNWLIAGDSEDKEENITLNIDGNVEGNIIKGQGSSQMTNQLGNKMLPASASSNKDCSGCDILESLMEQNKELTETNRKLTQKLIDKI